jgi:hypothetical protein
MREKKERESEIDGTKERKRERETESERGKERHLLLSASLR